jgi:ribonuclease VapC
VVFDAWTLVALLKAEEPAFRRVRALLFDAHKGRIACYMTLINLGEVYYTCGRYNGSAWATQKMVELNAMPITILSIDKDFVMQAAAYKMTYPISYADAFALAAAIQRKAVLVTGDPEFNKLTHLVTVELLKRN